MSARMDAWKLSYEEVHFLGTPGLFTSLRVSLRSLPDSVHRYEIREEGGGPCQLARGVLADHFGTLLTTDPIQLPPDGYLSFEDQDLEWGNGGAVTLAEFLRKYPPTGRDVIELRDALPEERDLLYSWDDGRDVKNGCIGHLRGDFEGRILHHTWWPHQWDEVRNNERFQKDLTRVVDWLRTGFAPLRDLNTMRAFCNLRHSAALPDEDSVYGFRVETKGYRYLLRCTPLDGYYHVYLYCYSKEVCPCAEKE